MTCFSQSLAEHRPEGGRPKILGRILNDNEGLLYPYFRLSCGNCIGCRMRRSQAWALRCMHEASMHKENTYLTLTYNKEHMPKDGNLSKPDLQKFIKRLRKKLGIKVKYFACGEYGDKFSRPHYHLLVFGYQFSDKQYFKKSNTGENYYISETLAKLWPQGFSIIGDVTLQSAAYVSRYVHKKMNGDKKESHYLRLIDEITGECAPVVPEFPLMSTKTAIGKEWYDKYHKDVFPSDEIIHEGRSFPVPEYYAKCLEKDNPELFVKIKEDRRNSAQKNMTDRTIERLIVKEKCAQAKLDRKIRSLEN